MFDVRRYTGLDGTDVVGKYLARLKDSTARARIEFRIAKLTMGLLGDTKSLGDGLHELRVDYGPGYRVYYANIGTRVILLLCAGDKRKQTADIVRAREYLADYKENEA